ncbi:hypothetical protein, partial [Sansalvadorimonas verongulae]|uniref:hypothetical protein n=1 Tax=Sansalvadorimonas verongulae TaxID=2172824 RepID=UPI001E29DD12
MGAFVGDEMTGCSSFTAALVTSSHGILFFIRSLRVHSGDARGQLVAVRLNLTHFGKSAICIEYTLLCTGAKKT